VYFHGHTVGGTNPALLQALALGAPVVARDTPFNREVAQTSAQFVGEDPNALAAVLARAVTDKKWRAEVGIAGRKRVTDAYNWLDICERYRELLEQQISAAEAKPSSYVE